MVPYSKEALAPIVRSLREAAGLTQEELGRKAGYRTGAGVSISRLESGLLRPSPERFAGVATALGLTPEELAGRALEVMIEDGAGVAAEGTTSAAAAAASNRTKGPPGQRELNARKERIEHEIGERTTAITGLSEAFNEQHDRAHDAFAVRFDQIAARVAGAPSLDAAQRQHGDVIDADDAAGNRPASLADRGVTAPGAGRGLAARAAVGTAVLAGIVALPVVTLFAGGIMIQRNRAQRREFAAQLDAAEAELAATGPGVRALQDILRRAAGTLDYIATHAGHALDRWEHQLGSGTVPWGSLGPADQDRYHDFIEIARAHDRIVTFDFPAILTARGRYQDDLIAHADEVLTGSDAAVRARV